MGRSVTLSVLHFSRRLMEGCPTGPIVWDTEVLLPQLPQVTEYSQLPGGVTHLRLLDFTINKLSRLVRHLLSVQFFKRLVTSRGQQINVEISWDLSPPTRDEQ